MLKTKRTVKRVRKKTKQYPYIGQHKLGTIVLFISPKTGLVLLDDINPEKFPGSKIKEGFFHNNIMEEGYPLYDGELTISNK